MTDAQEDLWELGYDDPPDPLLVALREAQIAANEAALATAKERLEFVTIVAPFAGIVSAVYADEGQSFNANNATTAVLEIVDTSVAEVNARLDEIDVLTVQVGAEAVVSLDGLPGAGLPGVVTSISQTGDNQQGVVTYPIQNLRANAPIPPTSRGVERHSKHRASAGAGRAAHPHHLHRGEHS